MASNSPWLWSSEYNDYYYVVKDSSGNITFVFRNQTQQGGHQSIAPAGPARSTAPPGAGHPSAGQYQPQPNPHGFSQGQGNHNQPAQRPPGPRRDSVLNGSVPNMAPPVPDHLRPRIRGLVEGTPDRGWYEPLDSSYRMRTGTEAREFFVKGRVFAMLWAEAASETAARASAPDGTVYRYPRAGYTPGRHLGEYVYSNIRRFVIMRVKKDAHFVYVCPITTYSQRGTTKPGCKPSEHTIVYFRGTDPNNCYLQGEYEGGMTKEPIEIEPADTRETMHPASRLRFGLTHPVAWNVKVKDIGKVSLHHMSKLIRYWKEEDFYDSDDDRQ